MRLFGISPKKIIIEQFRYILVIVAVIIVVIGYLTLIGPEINEVRQFGLIDRSTEEKLLEDRKNYLSRVEDMLDRYNSLNQRNLEELDRVLPRQSDIADLFVIVEDLVNNSDLQLNNISINPALLSQPGSNQTDVNTGSSAPVQDPILLNAGLKTFDISINVSGGRSYEHFKEFITNLENSLRLFNIQSLTFTPAQSIQGGLGELTAQREAYTVNLRTFYFVEET